MDIARDLGVAKTLKRKALEFRLDGICSCGHEIITDAGCCGEITSGYYDSLNLDMIGKRKNFVYICKVEIRARRTLRC